MAELGKKIDEQALSALNKDLDAQLAKSSITRYNKLKATQQALADVFSDETYASHDTKEWLEKTKQALEKVISERKNKWGAIPQYVVAMEKDLETINYRLAHLEKLNNETEFEVDNTWAISVDAIFLKESNDITRTWIDIKHEGITLWWKDVKVLWVDKNKDTDLLCSIDWQDFTISHEWDVISVIPSSTLLKGKLELSLLWVYGKEESGNTTKRVGQEKKVSIKASADDQKAFKDQDEAATMKAITDIDAIQDISGKTIDTFTNDQILLYATIDTVFNTHDSTKTYWKYLDDAQKKLFIDDLVRSNPAFSPSVLVKNDEAKDAFNKAILDYKNASATPKTTSEMEDAFIWFHKNLDFQKAVSEWLQAMLQNNIDAASDDTVKDSLAQFYKKFSTKKVSEFDLFYNKLENDQTGAFDKIKEQFEIVKQDTMIEAFKDAMNTNERVKNEPGLVQWELMWENIPGDQQARFCMQMVFQQDTPSTYPAWNRLQYIPTLNHKNILSLESFLETFKDEIAALAKTETDPTKLRWAIKTLIVSKLNDSAIKGVLKKKLVTTFSDKISQNITWANTNILQEMNKFAIDAWAYQPWYKKYITQNPTAPTTNTAINTTTQTAVTPAQLPDEFDITEYDEDKEMIMKASISDVKRVYEDQAEHAWEEALRKEYDALGKIKLFTPSSYNMLKRARLYFFREKIKNKTKEAELQKQQTNGVDMHRGELTAAADRHERMFNDDQWNNQKNEKDRIESLATWTNHPKIDELCREYLNSPTGMPDREFEDRFNTILASQDLKNMLKSNKITHTASNLLLKLRSERAYKTMMDGLRLALEQYASSGDASAYETLAKQHITTYVQLTQRGLSANLQKALKAPWAQVEKYRKWVQHEIGMAKMQANTLKIKIDVLKNGKWAYEVNNRDKEKNLIAKFGGWLDRNPKTALAISIWSTITAGALFINPLWMLLFATWKWALWMVSKKASNYTKEQKWEEKKLVRGLENEKARLANLKAVVNNSSMWNKIAIGSDTYKAVRQWQLYANTTQYEFMNDAKKDLANIQKQMLDLNKPALTSAVADALARLDYYVTSGHNFLGQQDDKNMEETMNDLQKLTVAGTETLGTTLADMRLNGSYQSASSNLNDNYTTLRKKFKKQRTILGVKYGLTAVAVWAWLRWVLGNDIHHNSYHSWSWSTHPSIPWHTPTPTPVHPTPVVPTHPDPNQIIHGHHFDAWHHDLYNANTFGMKPEVIYDHCTHVDVLESGMSKDVINHMLAKWELLEADRVNMLWAVDKMIHSHIPPSPYLEDKVAKYLYHFAERDAVFSRIINAGGDTVKNVIKDNVTDGGAWQSGWLDAFLAGGETLGRYLMNIASVASPMFANTFLENPQIAPRDKNGKAPGQPWYIPFTNTIVDPNKQPIAGGFSNEDPLNWIIRKWQNTPPTITPTQPTVLPTVNPSVTNPATQQPTNNTNPWTWNNTPTVNPSNGTNAVPTQPDPDNNVVITGPWDDTELQVQAELEKTQAEEFVNLLTGKMGPLLSRYQWYIDIYNELKTEFEEAKDETNMVEKINKLKSIKSRMESLRSSLDWVKAVADSSYDTFKEKYDDLPEAVQEKVKDKLWELQAFRRKTQTTIREIGEFIQTITEAINNVGTTPAVITPVVNVSTNTTQPANNSTQPVANTNQATQVKTTPAKKVVKPTVIPAAKNVPAAPVAKVTAPAQQPKLLDLINAIKAPNKGMSKDKYHYEVLQWYNAFLKIMYELEDRQRDIRHHFDWMERQLEKWNKIDKAIIDENKFEIDYFNERADAFADAFVAYKDAVAPNLDEKHKQFTSIDEKKDSLIERNNRIADFDEKLEQRLDDIENKNAAIINPTKNTTPATTTTIANSTNTPIANTQATPNTASNAPTITDASILEEFNKLTWNKILRIIKKDSAELFAQYKALIEKNPDMYNVAMSKKEIAISGIFDKNTWVWKPKQ